MRLKNLLLQWQAPKSWEQFDGHPMRMASFYVPHTVEKENYQSPSFQE